VDSGRIIVAWTALLLPIMDDEANIEGLNDKLALEKAYLSSLEDGRGDDEDPEVEARIRRHQKEIRRLKQALVQARQARDRKRLELNCAHGRFCPLVSLTDFPIAGSSMPQRSGAMNASQGFGTARRAQPDDYFGSDPFADEQLQSGYNEGATYLNLHPDSGSPSSNMHTPGSSSSNTPYSTCPDASIRKRTFSTHLNGHEAEGRHAKSARGTPVSSQLFNNSPPSSGGLDPFDGSDIIDLTGYAVSSSCEY